MRMSPVRKGELWKLPTVIRWDYGAGTRKSLNLLWTTRTGSIIQMQSEFMSFRIYTAWADISKLPGNVE